MVEVIDMNTKMDAADRLADELRWFCKTAKFGEGAVVDRFRRALANYDQHRAGLVSRSTTNP